MICKSCGKEVDSGKRFCGYCGTSMEDIPPNSIPKQDPEKPARKKRRKLLPFALILSFCLGISGGIWSACYVVNNGWGNVPFAEKFTFLPFVRLDKEKIETYPDFIDISRETEDEKGGN